MNKKILIISSSPRKNGNSDTLCDQFKIGAKEAGHHAEKIFLKEKNINYCSGCGYCFEKKEGCSQNDDMTEILNKMIDSDVIVMATPVYFYTMNGQMKTFIDRICAKYTSIKNKDFYFIATAAASGNQIMDKTIEEFRGLTYCLNGAKEKGIIRAVGVWNIGDVENTQFMQEAYNMGKNI